MTTPPTTTCTPLGLTPSFGFGDRIGLATPGHLAALRRSGEGIAPIFPQQSIREMERTSRNPEEVMEAAFSTTVAAGSVSYTHLTLPTTVIV